MTKYLISQTFFVPLDLSTYSRNIEMINNVIFTEEITKKHQKRRFLHTFLIIVDNFPQ